MMGEGRPAWGKKEEGGLPAADIGAAIPLSRSDGYLAIRICFRGVIYTSKKSSFSQVGVGFCNFFEFF